MCVCSLFFYSVAPSILVGMLSCGLISLRVLLAEKGMGKHSPLLGARDIVLQMIVERTLAACALGAIHTQSKSVCRNTAQTALERSLILWLCSCRISSTVRNVLKGCRMSFVCFSGLCAAGKPGPSDPDIKIRP